MATFYRTSVDFELERLKLASVRPTGRIIGKGAYGRVIEVYVYGTLCAAKEVHSSLIDNVSPWDFEAVKHTFLNECINSSRIHHPNVVQVLGIYYSTPQAKLPWLVMELMDTSLRCFLEKYAKQKVPHHLRLSILVDIAQGLEFLHSQDIVHRDLSSNNVLLTKHLVAKIADLGVAKVIEQNKMNTQTQTPGTLHFMPPEATSVKARYGKPVDIFSLACVALHTITHKWPEPKDRVQEDPITYELTALTEVARRKEYLQLCSLLPLRNLIASCLHNQPNLRPNVSAVCKVLKDLKTAEDQKVPVGTSNCVELLDALQQVELENHALRKTCDERVTSMGQKLYQVTQEKSLLQQHLNAKTQQLEMFHAKVKMEAKQAMENFVQERDQYQYYIQKAFSAQERMSQAMDQVSIF